MFYIHYTLYTLYKQFKYKKQLSTVHTIGENLVTREWYEKTTIASCLDRVNRVYIRGCMYVVPRRKRINNAWGLWRDSH